MILAALAVAAFAGTQEVVVEPSDDVWVYSFAQDQTSDEYLRVWGSETGAVEAPGEALSFSYSLLKFPAPKAGGRLVSAELVLHHVAEAKFEAADSKAAPLEARPAPAGFEEETWDYGMHPKFLPPADPASIYGTGWGAPSADEKPFVIKVGLLEGPNDFAAALKTAAETGSPIAIALTSKLRPDEAGDGKLYKLYSRANEASLRPRLLLRFD